MDPTARENIETIAKLEQKFLRERTPVERLGDAMGAFVGTMAFVLLHLAGFVLWFVINLGLIPHVRPFDPFPFVLLSVTVSIEAVLLTTFVLMKQNSMSKRAEQRNQLNLQIDMLSEREVTRIIQMLALICERLGMTETAHEPETERLSEETAVDLLAEELKRKIPE